MGKYRCTVCNYIYDEEKEEVLFSDLDENWRCPVCNASKASFEQIESNIIKESNHSQTTVSDVIIEQMVEWGVKYVFGIPGTSSLGVLQAIKDREDLNYFQVRHEQTAAFMASAYGKLTGHLAACLTIAGPGATNLATGLYDAKLDHSPVLALTGQVKRQLIGPGSFQEIDQHSFFEPISVFNKPVMYKEHASTLTALAIKQALINKGVAHLSIPNDVQKQSYHTKIIPIKGKVPERNLSPPDYLMKEASEIIDSCSRPVIIAGFGAMKSAESVLKLAEKISAPIVTTFRGKGIINENHELCVGSHGTIGSTSASQMVQSSDLLIVIGSSYSDMTQIPTAIKTIQIDIDPLIIGRQSPVEVGLLGDSAEIIPKLVKMVNLTTRKGYRDEIKNSKIQWLTLLTKEIDSFKHPIRPQYIMKILNEKIDPHAVITLDVGENAWWFGRNFQMKSTQKMVMSGYLASMGFGLPAALTAQIIYPEKQVVCITGDGGFSMVMADFLTAIKYKLPITVFVLNNQQLGMIKQEQKIEGYTNWQTELTNCDFAAFAENCGGRGFKVFDPSQLPETVEEALKLNEPTIVDIETDPRRFI